jgi:hypothetical protein
VARARAFLLWAAAGVLAGGLLVALRATHLPAGREATLCLVRRASGVPCPGCGLTRAFDRLSDADLAGAVAAHPLAPAIAAELALGWLLALLVLTGWLRPPAPGSVELLLLAHLAALVALWLGRAATGTLPW